MTPDIETILRLAEAAGGEEYTYVEGSPLGPCVCESDGDTYVAEMYGKNHNEMDRRGKFIAAANPAAIIALGNRLERAENALRRIRDWGCFTMPDKPITGARQIAKEVLGE